MKCSRCGETQRTVAMWFAVVPAADVVCCLVDDDVIDPDHVFDFPEGPQADVN